MSLNTWWVAEPGQRYWMEITDRTDVGGPLLSPKLPSLTWGYDLVSQVQPGDRVLHWSTSLRPSRLVGWSVVAEHARVIPVYTWTPRHGDVRTTPGWSAALGGFHPFEKPVTAKQLRPLLDEIVAVDELLGARHHGGLYFPLTRYGANRPKPRQELRAAEAYFVKFPLELFDVIPGIGAARIEGALDLAGVDVPEDYQPPSATAPLGRTTRAQDPAHRDAVERRSLDVAREYYASLGGLDYMEIGAPYDIEVTVGAIERRCEVKGSSVLVQTVELTRNEVRNATEDWPAVDLIVVDGIEVIRDPDTGEVTAAQGGRLRVWADWIPAEESLRPTKYAYDLPAA